MQYLPAEEKHIPEIVELCKNGFHINDTKLLTKLFTLYLKRGVLIVAYEDKVAGYMAGRYNTTFLRDALSTPSLLIFGRNFLTPWHLRLLSADGAYLASMSVHPDFKGQGIAHKLVQSTVEKLQKHTYIEIESSNNAMRAILQDLKFELLTPVLRKITHREIWHKI